MGPNDVELNRQQQTYSDLSAKSMMLFGIAIMSSILLFSLMFTVEAESGMRAIFLMIDFCINLWCIYLQFTFAKKQYKKCCGWCDRRCKGCMLYRTRRMIHAHDLSMFQKKTSVESADGHTDTTANV